MRTQTRQVSDDQALEILRSTMERLVGALPAPLREYLLPDDSPEVSHECNVGNV